MDGKLLRDSLEVLYGLREELHSKADDSVIEQLDRVISDLQKAVGNNPNISARGVLEAIGSALKIFSTIEAIIKALK